MFTYTQVQDEDLPYFSDLRNKDTMEAMKRINQMAHMLVWSQDVQGIIKMSEVPRKTVYRSKSAKPVRNKTLVQLLTSVSLPTGKISSESPKTIPSTTEDDVCYDVTMCSESPETITSHIDDDVCYEFDFVSK